MNKVKQKMKICTIVLGITYSTILLGGEPCHRFLSLRPPFQSGSPERESFTNKFRCERSFLQVVPFFGHTLSPEHISRYFFPFNKYSILTREADSTEFNRDFSSLHFNIVTKKGTFESHMTIKASHEFFGVGLAYRHAVNDTWWFEFGIPFLTVKNKFDLNEKIINNGGGVKPGTGLDDSPFVNSMTEAFRQKNWLYGKIDSGKTMTKTGVGDLEFKVGYRSESLEKVVFSGYLGLAFPTSNKPRAKFMFEPMLGSNGHYGLLLGSHIGIDFWKLREHYVFWNVDFNTRYLFANHQWRSFDLKGKEFSAYISSYSGPAQAQEANALGEVYSGTSGINLYTQKVQVSPGFSFSAINSLVYGYKNFEMEAGYNFYARQNEKIFVDWKKNSAIKDRDGLGATNLARNMNADFVGAAGLFPSPSCKIPPTCPFPSGGCNYFNLFTSDLAPNSAGTSYVLSYTFYLTLGYHFNQCKCPMFIGLGGSYEIGASTDMGQMMAWAKLEVSF